jgi:hypothetical protein
MRRLSTLTFARRACARLDHGAKLREALDLALAADILETMDAHDGARFFILGCYQSLKSALGQLRLARNHWIRPRPAGWYAPTIDFAKKFADEKLNPLLEAIYTAKDSDYTNIALKQSKLYWKFTSGSHHILSANTENDRTGATYCDLYFDEPHLYEPGWIKQASNRRGAYPEEFTETFMSTGLTLGDGATGSEAAAIWAETDQRTWHVRCPTCKKYYEPKYTHREKEDDPESPIIGGLVYQRAFLESGLPDQTAIAASLVYQCPRCRVCRLQDHHGSRMELSGTASRPTGIYVSRNATPAPRTFGWTFNAIAIRPWLPIVIGFELAQLARKRGDLEPLGRWIREEMAGVWEPEKYLRTKRARPLGKTHYQLGTDWPDEAVDYQGRPTRALTCDVQRDRFIYVIRMWARDGRSRLRAHGIVTSPGAIRDLAKEHGVIPDRVYLDGRHDGQYVKKVAALQGWRVLMGEKDKDYYHQETGLRRIFSSGRDEDAFSGTIHGRAVAKVFMFSKQAALSRLQILRTTETPTGDLMWTVAEDAHEWYLKEIDAHYRKKYTTKEGQEYWQWEGFHDDHAGDCEAMQVVFASMAGLIGSESLETTAQNQKPETELKAA